MPKRLDTREYFALTLKELSLNKPIDKITISEIAEASGFSRKNFYYYFQDKYDLMVWYYNYEGDRLIHENIGKDWSEILVLFLNDIRIYQSWYLTIFADTGQSPLLHFYYDFIVRTMKDYAEERGNRLSEDDYFYLMYIACGNTRLTKYWLENGCVVDTDVFAAKLVSAYPESMKKIFR